MTEPRRIAALVEDYVDRAHDHAAKYDNSTPLDESGVWSLHELAATIYEAGFADGAAVQGIREQGLRQRRRDAEARDKAAEATP
jgi:hypothetical protein